MHGFVEFITNAIEHVKQYKTLPFVRVFFIDRFSMTSCFKCFQDLMNNDVCDIIGFHGDK